MTYHIRQCPDTSLLTLNWHSPGWQHADELEVNHFRPEGSPHHPKTQARVVYADRTIHGLFQVHDQHVRCVRTGYGSEVWKDSCVEFFIEPKPGRGYFNFEFNCGGAFLCNHIVDPTRTADFFQQATRVPLEIAQAVSVKSTMPRVVEPEEAKPTTWLLQYAIPCSVMEHFVGPLGELRGQIWRGNFYKCADESSHPHWGSWSPVDEFNFHLPRCFGEIVIA